MATNPYPEWDYPDLYVPPTLKELRALLAAWGLTGKLAGLLTNTKARTARRWVDGERGIGYTYLYTLCSRFAEISITPWGWREELADVIAIGEKETYYALARSIEHLIPPQSEVPE